MGRSPMLSAAGVSANLAGGFADTVFDSQRVFRAMLEAMSQPGRIVTVDGPVDAPAPLYPATVALCLALADLDTPLWVQPAATAAQSEALARFLRFHCGCPLAAEPAGASFALIHDASAMPALAQFCAGSGDFPDRSTTVIVQVHSLAAGTADAGVQLTGPGIRDRARLSAAGLPARFWPQWRDNNALFPCGVDVVLVAGRELACLPRTVTAIAEMTCT